jgi:hypothetical protein
MGWISDLWERVSGSTAEDLTVIKNLTVPGSAPGAIVADECYVEVYVDSLRLEKARRFATTFSGAVYAYQTLAREGEGSATLAAVSKPENLAKLDSDSLGNVIQVSRKLTGPVPWRGGTMHLELGLFSVKSGNLLSPVLDFVTQVSTTAGVSFISAALPFVPLLTKGMDLIAGQVGDVALEVAYDEDIDLHTTGTHAIIAKPRGQIDLSRITVDPTDHKLLLNGAPLPYGYCVFSIRSTTQKADWGDIPALKEAYANVLLGIRSKNRASADDALDTFRRAAHTTPDLISSDADAIVDKAGARVESGFKPKPKGSGIAAALVGTLSLPEDEKTETLYDLNLYAGR